MNEHSPHTADPENSENQPNREKEKFTLKSSPDDQVARFSRPKTTEELKKSEISPEKPDKPKFTRRRFLQLTAIAMGGTAAVQLFGRHFKAEKAPQLPPKPDYETETNESTIEFLEVIRLKPDILPAFLEQYQQPESSYGTFAASSVSFCTTIDTPQSLEFIFGSGSIVEHHDELYLSTAFHVIDSVWLDDSLPLTVAIPGIEQPIRCNTRDLYSFGRIPPLKEDPDLAIFIKLDEDTTQLIRQLEEKNKLTPLKPYGFFDFKTQKPISDELAIFRFQESRVFMDYLKPLFFSADDASILKKMYAESDEPVTCGGVSGSPILRVENGTVLSEIAGVVQDGVSDGDHPRQPDPAGVLGDECNTMTAFVPFTNLSVGRPLHLDGSPAGY